MFKVLALLLKSSPTIVLTICQADNDRLRLTITPHRSKEDKDVDDDLPSSGDGVLNRPLTICGTIDELEVDLPAQLERYAQNRTSMREVFEGLDKEYEEAKAEAKRKIDEERKRTSAGIPTVAKPPLLPAAAKPATPVKPKAPASIF